MSAILRAELSLDLIAARQRLSKAEKNLHDFGWFVAPRPAASCRTQLLVDGGYERLYVYTH